MLLMESFLDYLRYERNYSDKTILAYQKDLSQFEAFGEEGCQEKTPLEVTGELVRDWIVNLMDGGYSVASVNRKLSSLRSYYKYLLKKGEVRVDPLQKVVGPKKSKPLPVFLKEKDMDRLLDEENFADDFEGWRDRLILEVFYETGIRKAELIGLNSQDVDFSTNIIKVLGKRNKERLIPFGSRLGILLQEYIKKRNETVLQNSDAFFVRKNGERLSESIVASIVRRNLSKVVAVRKKSPHVLRHTFATAMLNHGAELDSIKELLGHESLSTTEIYTHTTFEELKKVYNQAHPRA